MFFVIFLTCCFFGINGVGKTTSLAKLAYSLLSKGKSVVFAACDTFRAGAIDQLQHHADKLNVKCIRHDYGTDPASVSFDAISYAKKKNIDYVLIDTAGRLQSNSNLMQELEKIVRVSKPHYKIYVGESLTGNDCIDQVSKYDEILGIDGVILTKSDSDEKGGTILSVSVVTGKPILFLGVGQEYKDLIMFNKHDILEKLQLT